MWISSQIAKKIKVYYVNADVSGVDAKRYYYQAKKYGFNLLLPDMKAGLSMMNVVYNLEKMNKIERDYSDTLFIFDTLKKMTDVINKTQSKSLYRTLRGLTAKGMTIILLAHTNKYKDSDDNYIFEGTGDLRSDVDELIYLIPQKHDDGSLTVSTLPDKVRGDFKPITFEISKDREVSQSDYVDTIKHNKWKEQHKKDEHIIEAIYLALQDDKSVQIDIIKYCHEKYKIGNKSTKRVLDYFSEGNNKLWIAERGTEFNKITYRKVIDSESGGG